MARIPKHLKRKVGGRVPKKRFYIFCEGKKTEPQYILAYERKVSSTIIEIVCENERGAPTTLLEKAQERMREIKKGKYINQFGNDDQIWVVFDRDEHPLVNEVLEACRTKNIQTAFSNPCFEVWLILHRCDYDRDEHWDETQKECERVCEGYNRKRGKLPNLDKLLNNVEDAETRAEKLETRRKEDGGEAPLTTFYKLTRAMRGE